MTFPVWVRILQVVTFWFNVFGLVLAIDADKATATILVARIVAILTFGFITVFNIIELYENRQNS